MEDLIWKLIEGEELSELNRCRIFLKAKCLSDLATGNRKSIPPIFWYRKTRLMKYQYKWPHQPRPHQRAWEKWQAALQTTFKLSLTLALPVHLRLCPRLPSASTNDGYNLNHSTGSSISLLKNGHRGFIEFLGGTSNLVQFYHNRIIDHWDLPVSIKITWTVFIPVKRRLYGHLHNEHAYVPKNPDYRNLTLPAPKSDLTYHLFDDNYTIGTMFPHAKSRNFGSLLGKRAGYEQNFFLAPTWIFLVRWFRRYDHSKEQYLQKNVFPENSMKLLLDIILPTN